MTRRGLLLAMSEPPPQMEDEFNAWYDTEHLPERLSIAGFRSARRWVADVFPGEGKYLASYELDSASVLQSVQYLAHVGDHFTPWTRRCLNAAVLLRRWACEQIEPGAAEPHPDAVALAFACGERPPESLALPGLLQVRRFAATSGTPRHIALFELADPNVAVPLSARVYRAYRVA